MRLGNTVSFRPAAIRHIETNKVLNVGEQGDHTVKLIGQPEIRKCDKEKWSRHHFTLKIRLEYDQPRCVTVGTRDQLSLMKERQQIR